jgi:hypothetical protein
LTALFKPKNFDRELLIKASGLTHKFVVFYHGSMGGGAYNYARGRGVIDTIQSMKLLKKSILMWFCNLAGVLAEFRCMKEAIAEYVLKNA